MPAMIDNNHVHGSHPAHAWYRENDVYRDGAFWRRWICLVGGETFEVRR